MLGSGKKSIIIHYYRIILACVRSWYQMQQLVFFCFFYMASTVFWSLPSVSIQILHFKVDCKLAKQIKLQLR